MSKLLRVLILEDDAVDAELAARQLRRAGFDPQWQRVETEAAFLVALAEVPDVILADYSLPSFDGLRALAQAREHAPDIPFILMSGSLGEEAAVAAMKQGASDFLLKDRLTRLGPAVERALQEQELRRAARDQDARIARLSRIRAVFGGISSAMLRVRDRDQLLDEACRVAVRDGVFPLAWVSIVDGPDELPRIVALHGSDLALFSPIRDALFSMQIADRPTSRVATSGQRLVVNDVALDDSLGSFGMAMRGCGYLSVALFPLAVEARVVAVLSLLAAERDFFDAEEIALLDWLSADLSFALDSIAKSAQLAHLAYFDALTGLCNARSFQDRLDRFVDLARDDHTQVCVVVADLTGFTLINDSLGRAVGDEVLRQVGARFGKLLSEPFALGRIGADTFAAASTRDSATVPTQLQDQMLDALKSPFVVGDREIRVSAQLGIALFPADGVDGDAVFRGAESALKFTRSSGDTLTYFSSEMNTRLALRRVLNEELELALEQGQFVLHYQPRVDMISGELIGAEALIRWQHPQRGLIAPIDFVGAAEESGLIIGIGAWVLNAVCAQQATWLAAGVGIVPIAVNLSSVQFNRCDLLQTVRDALAQHGLAACHLDLELTESAVMVDPAAATQTLLALRKMGSGLALDDFGTGYASLAHLKRFPFNSVKIDRSFVTDITINAGDAAIATAIIAMAHSMGLRVVAEGVETQGQFNYLRALACDEMQGNFFCAAVPVETFESSLRDGRRMHLQLAEPADLRTLLLVDDEQSIRAALTRMLRPDGYRILSAESGEAALELLAVNSVQVIISDQRMPGMSGTTFLNTVRQLYPDTVRIILSGYTDLAVVTDAVNRGSVFKFLTKPWDDELLREQVRDAFRRHRQGTSKG